MTEILKIALIISLLAIEYEIEIYNISTYVVEFVAAILFFSMLYKFRKGNINKNHISIAVCAGWLLYCCGIFSVLVVHNTVNFQEIIKYMFIVFIGTAVFFSFYIDEGRYPMWKTYYNLLIALGVMVVLIGIFETYYSTDFPKRFNSMIWGKSNRMTSRFLLLIPLAYYRGKHENELYYIPFYILVLGVVMTISRAGIIVLSVFLLANARDLLGRKNIGKTVSAFTTIFIINYVVGIIPSLMYRYRVLLGQLNFRISNDFNGVTTGMAGDSVQSSISRMTLWKTAIQDFNKNELFGIGVDNYRTYYMSYRGKVEEINAHNWILQVMAETGTVGLVVTMIFIVFIYYAYRKGYKRAVNEKNRAALTAAASGMWSLGLYLMHNLLEASANSLMFGFGGVSIFMLLITGISLGAMRSELMGIRNWR